MTNIYCVRPKGFNVGNEAIQVAVRHLLDESFGEPVNVINLPATSRYESHNKGGFGPATVHEMNQYGDGVLVGGGNLYENGELEVDPQALAALEIPMMLFSLSLGRIYNRRGELVRRTDSMKDETIRRLHEAAALSVARDQATADHLGAIGAETMLGGCPTLYLQAATNPAIPRTEGVADVLISVRTPELMSVPLGRRMRVREDIERIVELVRERGSSVRLLCHDHRDIPFAASVSGVDYLYTDDVYAYLGLLRGTSLCISYRLHSLLPCLSFGTPVVKISYDERGNSMMRTIDMESWNIDMMASEDVAAEVEDRVGRLAELDGRRADAAARWSQLREVQRGAGARFAELVRAHQRRNEEAHAGVRLGQHG